MCCLVPGGTFSFRRNGVPGKPSWAFFSAIWQSGGSREPARIAAGAVAVSWEWFWNSGSLLHGGFVWFSGSVVGLAMHVVRHSLSLWPFVGPQCFRSRVASVEY